ncbi:MAG TPA: response regulator [Cellvibrio sp.]|nr:response regulator [Cellvibrio sp.]
MNSPRSKLSIRLVLATLLYSLLVALVVSAVQIYISYQQSIEAAKERFTQIEMGYLPSLQAGLWEVNSVRVAALLDSMAQLSHVGKIELVDEQRNIIARNQDSHDSFAQKDMPLRYSENNSHYNLGTLHIELTHSSILAQLKARAISIAITTLLTLSIGSVLVLVLFQHWVSRHLHRMAQFAAEFNPTSPGTRLSLERPEHYNDDELAIVVNSINSMQQSLQKELNLRAEVEQQLRAHKENLEMLVASRTFELESTVNQLGIASEIAELGLWTWNIADKSLHWNERMYIIYSLPLSMRGSELHNKHWFKCIHPEDAPAIAAILEAAVKGEAESIQPVFRIFTPKGETRYVQAGAKLERDDMGNPVKLIGITRDITSQRELETRLIHAKEQADQASAAKSSFLANMSHEIRTPMNAILGMLQLVQQTDLSLQQKDYLSKTQSAAKSLLGLLNDILDYSKDDAGKLQLDNHPFALESLMRDLAVVLSGNQAGKNIEVMFDMDPLLPKNLVSDQLRLQQVLINLAGNALKFTLEGYVVISLTALKISSDSASIRIAVSDTGIGIKEEQKERIFDRFVQAEASTTRRFGGTGLGLVISKRLVSLLGGELKLESEFGRGSRFWFDLNLPIAASEINQSKSADISQLRILVIDDNEMSRNLLTRSIRALGGKVDTAENIQIASEKITATELSGPAYDVVLLDLYMPAENGPSAAELIQQIPCRTAPAIIMLAAFGREEFREKRGAIPPIHFLTKPFTPQQMTESICSATQCNNPPESPAPKKIKQQPLAGLNLLVVEDNEFNRQVAYELLTGQGAQVSLAENGQQGVTTVLEAKQHFDVVIMDLQMPDMDGMEATRLIRKDQRFSQLPILAMTANASQSDRDECLAAGMTDHIGKPIDLAKLVDLIVVLVKQTAN